VQGDTKSLDGSVLIWDRGDVGVVTRVSIDEGFLFTSCSHFAHSFGRCVNSNVRSDQCHILEPTELLRVSHTVK